MADAASATTTDAGRAGPPVFALTPRNAKRRRRPERKMTEEEIEDAKKRVKVTLRDQHKEKTRNNYEQYLPPLHDWYLENRAQVCDEDGIDLNKFYRAIETEDGLNEEVFWFRVFLEKRPHISLINPETNEPMRALVGTLGGYRSAFAYFAWTKQGKTIPLKWDQQLKGMFKGFKSQEARLRQCGTLRMTEGQNQLTVPLFEALGHHFWEEGHPEHAFTNSWAWNLMCRSMNVNKLTCSAMAWMGDCISVEFGETKTSNGKKVMLKNVYCNPFKPWVRSVLLS